MKTRTLLLALLGAAGALLALSQPLQERPHALAGTPTPSPALLDAMNSHGIGAVTKVAATADAPPLQPALYHGGDNR